MAVEIVQVRARDLKPGDVIRDTTREGFAPKWAIVERVKLTPLEIDPDSTAHYPGPPESTKGLVQARVDVLVTERPRTPQGSDDPNTVIKEQRIWDGLRLCEMQRLIG